MKFTKHTDLKAFLKAVDKCEGDVLLVSNDGDEFNLKSMFSKYIAIGELLGDHGDELELFCANKDDEHIFLNFFSKHHNVL